VLQCVAVCCSVLQCVRDYDSTPADFKLHCFQVLQCVLLCCSVLPCIVMCCSVLQSDRCCNILSVD